jgi:hypothetical protein
MIVLSRNERIKVYRYVILPFVLSGYKTWYLILREEHRLKVRVPFILDMMLHHCIIRAQCFKRCQVICKDQNVREDDITTLPHISGPSYPVMQLHMIRTHSIKPL